MTASVFSHYTLKERAVSLIDRIKSVFGLHRNPEFSMEQYANYALAQLIEESGPFTDWRPQDAEIPIGMENTFKVYVWMYQMWIFYMLTARRFGYQVADRVLQIQATTFGRLSEELGKQLHLAVEQIQRNVSRQVSDPVYVEVNGETIELPIEYSVAIELLTIGDGAPFQTSEADRASGKPPEFGGTDIELAACLEHGKAAALTVFQRVVENIRVAF